MVEVFKTNVTNQHDAELLLNRIHTLFTDYEANFDLDDCDHILRVASGSATIRASFVVDLLKRNGFFAEVLCDEPVPLWD